VGSTAGCAANGGIAGLTYRSQNWAINIQKAFNWKASASYVTGQHSMKVGYQPPSITQPDIPGPAHRICDAISNGFQTSSLKTWPAINDGKPRPDLRASVRSNGCRPRHILGALRRPRQQFFPEQKLDQNKFLRPTSASRTIGVTGDDLTPAGMAWDLRGNGKTAVKINAGRYLQNAVADNLYTATNPLSDIPVSVTRTWRFGNRFSRYASSLSKMMSWRLRTANKRYTRRPAAISTRLAEPECEVRPGAARRLGRAPRRLADRRLHPTRGAAAGLGRGRL
jgi:hypothetical protein